MKTKNKKPAPAGLKVRNVKKADWPAVSALYEQCFGPSYSGMELGKAVVAVRGKTIIGFALYEIRKDEVYVANVGVDEKNRGCGTCNKMAKALVKLLPKLRRAKMTLIVARDNPHAIKCYRQAGFRLVPERIPGYTGSMLDMEYKLPRKRKGGKAKNKAKA